jgi:hypothetical protein
MKGEMSRAAGTLQAAQARFLSLLEAFKAKLPEEPPVEAAREDHVVPNTASQAATTSEAEPTSPEPAPRPRRKRT